MESDRHLVSELDLLLVLVILPEAESCYYPEDLEALVLPLLAPSGAKPYSWLFAYWGFPWSWLLRMVLQVRPQVSARYFQKMNEVKCGGVLRVAVCLPASCGAERVNGCTIIGKPVAAAMTSIGVDTDGPRSP